MKFGTGSNAERTQKYGGQSTKMTCVRPNIESEPVFQVQCLLWQMEPVCGYWGIYCTTCGMGNSLHHLRDSHTHSFTVTKEHHWYRQSE